MRGAAVACEMRPSTQRVERAHADPRATRKGRISECQLVERDEVHAGRPRLVPCAPAAPLTAACRQRSTSQSRSSVRRPGQMSLSFASNVPSRNVSPITESEAEAGPRSCCATRSACRLRSASARSNVSPITESEAEAGTAQLLRDALGVSGYEVRRRKAKEQATLCIAGRDSAIADHDARFDSNGAARRGGRRDRPGTYVRTPNEFAHETASAVACPRSRSGHRSPSRLAQAAG
jgi:hypothetical protein